jgi:hypothetical protein
MYVSEQLSILGARLEDIPKTKFPESIRLIALRNAEIKIVQLVHNAYLTELQAIKTSLAVTSGVASMTDIGNIVIRGEKGVLKAKIHGGLWISPIEFDDAKQQENPLYSGTLLNPQYYIFANQIFVTPITITSIDVYYLRMPAVIYGTLTQNAFTGGGSTTEFCGVTGEGLSTTDNYYNGAIVHSNQLGTDHIVTDYAGATFKFTVEPALSTYFSSSTFSFINDPFNQTYLTGTQSELNPSLHQLMTTLAEAELWGSARDFDRQTAANKSAELEIQTLNSRYTPAEGIGVAAQRGKGQ